MFSQTVGSFLTGAVIFYRLTFSFRRDVAFLKGISRHSGGLSGIHLKLLRLIFYLVVSPLVIFFSWL